MFTVDRTAKCLLAAIAVLLAILVAKPMFQVTPDAQAQSQSQWQPDLKTANNSVIVGYQTVPVTMLKVNRKDPILSVQVIESAQSFIVRYSDRLEIYRVDDVTDRELMAAQEKMAKR